MNLVDLIMLSAIFYSLGFMAVWLPVTLAKKRKKGSS